MVISEYVGAKTLELERLQAEETGKEPVGLPCM